MPRPQEIIEANVLRAKILETKYRVIETSFICRYFNICDILLGAIKTEMKPYKRLPGARVKVKESRNRLGVARKVLGGSGSQIFMTFGT